MNSRFKSEQLDMDSFFDFNQSTTQPSPSTATTATPRNASQDWNAFDQYDERQQFNGPSHDYQMYKQQVGLPVDSIANVPMQSMFDGYDSGISDMGLGWGSGIDIDSEMTMDFNNPSSAMPQMFFTPTATNTNADNFVDPNSIGGHEEATSNVGRLWPGMHSQQAQQANMQKAAQAQAVQQRQLKLQAQHAQYRQPGNNSQSALQQGGKRPSHVSEPHVEESISRLLSQMRNGSTVSNDDDEDSPSDAHHIARMKKDEEEMDEDERLLASEEGKKLSSKERRQLRNKVSARAFRSRRKEYIGQLEGEVALKAEENTNLRNENNALMQENDRYRTLIETLLRHPSFTPFINDISKDPTQLLQPSQPQQQQTQPPPPAVTPAQQPSQPQQQSRTPAQQPPQPHQESKPDYMNFDASQLQIPQQQPQQQPQQREHVGLAMIPENDFSKLNINGFNQMRYNFNSSVNAYAVTDVPVGPDPLELLQSPARLPTQSVTSAFDPTFTTNFDTTASDFDMTGLLAKLDGTARSMKYLSNTA